MNNEKIGDVLKGLGLTKTEIAIYTDLLRQDSSTAQEISKRVKIYRANTYESLRRLKSRGFISESKVDGKTLFSARGPEFILDYAKQKLLEIESIIPHMKRFSKNSENKETVSVSHGLVHLRSVLLEILNLKQPIFVYDVPIDVVEKMGEGFLAKFHRERIKRKIPLKAIYVKQIHRMNKLNKMPYTETRYFTGEKDMNIYTLICWDCICIIVFGEPLTVIEIKNKDIADSYKSKFDVFWAVAKK